jgi:hypothetical protein
MIPLFIPANVQLDEESLGLAACTIEKGFMVSSSKVSGRSFAGLGLPFKKIQGLELLDTCLG